MLLGRLDPVTSLGVPGVDPDGTASSPTAIFRRRSVDEEMFAVGPEERAETALPPVGAAITPSSSRRASKPGSSFGVFRARPLRRMEA